MKSVKLSALTLLLTGFSASALALPNITLLATGGTIAGGGDSATKSNYTAGKLGVEALVDAVPELKNVANVQGEQVVNIGSQDMNDQVWLTLAKKIDADCGKTDGFVITHGTDTLEETAYFLDLTVKCDKPVVLVGAMRPATAMSADGPFNLYNAVVTAADQQSANRGVLVAMNDTVLDARDVTKTNTTAVQTFQSPNYGPLGYIHNGKIDYQRSPQRKHTRDTPFDVSKLNELPKVGIIYNYANASDAPAKALIAEGYQGIVSAGVGNGNLYKTVFDTLATAAHNGVAVVRSSRVPTGATTEDAEVDDAKYGFVAAGTLNPQKSAHTAAAGADANQRREADPADVQSVLIVFSPAGAGRALAAILAEYSIKHRVNPLNFPMSQGFIVQTIATAAEPVITRRGRLPPTGE